MQGPKNGDGKRIGRGEEKKRWRGAENFSGRARHQIPRVEKFRASTLEDWPHSPSLKGPSSGVSAAQVLKEPALRCRTTLSGDSATLREREANSLEGERERDGERGKRVKEAKEGKKREGRAPPRPGKREKEGERRAEKGKRAAAAGRARPPAFRRGWRGVVVHAGRGAYSRILPPPLTAGTTSLAYPVHGI